MLRRLANSTIKAARQIVVAIVGFTVLIIGVIMLITPGPAVLVIPLGLAILSAEFAFARSWLQRIRERISTTQSASLGKRAEEHRASSKD